MTKKFPRGAPGAKESNQLAAGMTMAQVLSDDEVIDAVAQLLGKEREHGREEIEKLRWQLANAEDYAKVLAEEVNDLRQQVIDLKNQLTQAHSKKSEAETREMPRPRKTTPAPQPAGAPSTERRSSTRRRGNPVRVIIHGNGWDGPIEGWVLDRSAGGLGLLIDQNTYPTELLKIRSSLAHDTALIDAEVCYCIPANGSFRTGVKFERELPWLDIQQFG